MLGWYLKVYYSHFNIHYQGERKMALCGCCRRGLYMGPDGKLGFQRKKSLFRRYKSKHSLILVLPSATTNACTEKVFFSSCSATDIFICNMILSSVH